VVPGFSGILVREADPIFTEIRYATTTIHGLAEI
jgi:hypothetical protein